MRRRSAVGGALEMFSLPLPLTYFGRFTYISDRPLAVGQVQDSESLAVKAYRCTTEPTKGRGLHGILVLISVP